MEHPIPKLITVKAYSLVGHPAVGNQVVPIVEIIDGVPHYKGKPLHLSAKGMRYLRHDIKNQ